MFRDRIDAGRQLSVRLTGYAAADPVVLGMARGGMVVAAEIARALSAPCDVVVVRKVGHPRQPELAVGAVAEGDVAVMTSSECGTKGETPQLVTARAELARRAGLYRSRHSALPLDGRTVIVVDDGIATGATARAACLSARSRGADHVVLAVPVAPSGWVEELGHVADEYIALVTSRTMTSVGEWYENFAQVDDDEVIAVLEAAAVRSAEMPPSR